VLNFMDSKLEHSNLGGAGPDVGEKNMRYLGIGVLDGEDFDMVIEATSPYTAANNLDNGFECGQPAGGCINGRYAQVNVAVDSSVDLKISFQNSATQEPVTLNKFLLSIHDIDQFGSLHAGGAKVKERIYTTGFSGDPIVANNTEVGVREVDIPFYRSRLIRATSTAEGALCDNPANPLDLQTVTCEGRTVDQMKRSIAFLFENTDSVVFTFEVTCNECEPGGGRSFLISGDSNLVHCDGRNDRAHLASSSTWHDRNL